MEQQQEANCWKSFTKNICCQSDPIYPTPYKFNFNGKDLTPENKELFQTNYVRTSKYTPISFFPKAGILQFRRLANCYFLLIAILQTIPAISPLSPVTAWAPFIVVLAISMLREGYEDFQRMKSDRETNYGTMTKVMRNGKFEEVNWSNVLVGDIVMTEAQEMFPADLILLVSSGDEGAAFIETASLDGQKNLKPRNAFKSLISYNNQNKISSLKGQFETDPPDKQLNKLSAVLTIDGFRQKFQINNIKQLLYRGTRLKNTKWIYGLAILTGRNTKIIMNSKSEASKMSQIEIKVNFILVGILIVQTILSIVCAIAYSVFKSKYSTQYSDYINWNQNVLALDSFLIFLSYFVLLNTMIPISLVVSIEIVKFFQMIFIQKDQLLYSEYRGRGVTVKSASLNQQLGQIQYVFSDKTGTLTMNIMQFKIAVIGSQMFGDISLILQNKNQKDQDGLQKQQQKAMIFKDDKLKNLLETGAGDKRLDQPITIKSSDGRNQLKISTLRQLSIQYIKCLGLAHQVMPDKNKAGEKVYLGPSPDEITLVDGARAMGYQFMRSTQADTILKIHGAQTTYELLQVFQFNSDRKRMSIVIRDNGVIKMYMKGADSIVMKRLSKQNKLNLNFELQRFSLIGLRTLLIAMKTISDDQYKTFRAERAKLKGKAAGPEKQKAENQLINKFEQNMFIIGATAVLDRLQDEVPQTIRDLLRANIKVWMLTGDKMETAENIAKSCNLIQSDFQVIKYSPDKNSNQEAIVAKLRQIVEQLNKLKQQQRPKGLLIDGNDLTPIFQSQEASIQLANISKNCEAVVCCRLLPSQKAEVVRLVRKHLNKITLAIGDGANDVPMIKQAHIGVGLYGEEGMGAVQASDYALPQFRMLWRVLLVHGRWNYVRISQMILYFFYKNMLFTLPQFYIAFYCGWSSQTIFDDWYIALYNLIFTSLPLIIRAVLQQDVNYILKVQKNEEFQTVPTLKTLIKQQSRLPNQYKTNKYLYRLFPKIYFIGQENCIFNQKNYLAWMAEALPQSIAIFFFTFYVISHLSVNEKGINADHWLTGLTIYSSVILVVTFKLATHTKFWSILLVATISITSLGFYTIYMWLSNFFLTDNVKGTTYVGWTSAECYFVVLFCICMVLFVDGMVVFTDFHRGGYASRMREIIKQEKMNQRKQYDAHSLTITDNVTTNTQKIDRKDYEEGKTKSRLNPKKK